MSTLTTCPLTARLCSSGNCTSIIRLKPPSRKESQWQKRSSGQPRSVSVCAHPGFKLFRRTCSIRWADLGRWGTSLSSTALAVTWLAKPTLDSSSRPLLWQHWKASRRTCSMAGLCRPLWSRRVTWTNCYADSSWRARAREGLLCISSCQTPHIKKWAWACWRSVQLEEVPEETQTESKWSQTWGQDKASFSGVIDGLFIIMNIKSKTFLASDHMNESQKVFCWYFINHFYSSVPECYNSASLEHPSIRIIWTFSRYLYPLLFPSLCLRAMYLNSLL